MASITKHFKGFSIVQGDIKVNLDLSRFEKQYQDAQSWLDGQVMTDMEPYIPKQGGVLYQRTVGESAALQGTGLVVAAAGPYGRFIYEGKTMVDILTGSPWARKDAKKVIVSQYAGQTNAKENLTYSNAKTVPHWFDTAKEQHLKEWVDGVKKRAGGG